MKKLFTLFAASMALSLSVNAQLQVGSLAPDWTYKDINGVTQHLYNYLDSGYTVIIDISATWCGPCWSMHTSHVAEELTDHYGPVGSVSPKKIKFFLVEGDPTTNSSDLHGNTQASQGDWTAGTNYSIIDTADITNSYPITGFPTVFTICPSKRIMDVAVGYGGNMGQENYWTGLMNTCPQPLSGTDATVVTTDVAANACGLNVQLQNMGTQTITAANVSVYSGSAIVATQPWTGNLATYGVTTVNFPNAAVPAGQGTLTYKTVVTGDMNTANDALNLGYSLTGMSGNKVKVEVKTDTYAEEVSWKLMDGNNIVAQRQFGSSENNQTFTNSYTVGTGACLQFILNDGYGDGMSNNTQTTTDDGVVKIYDDANNALLLTINGADYITQATKNLKAAGTPSAVSNVSAAGALSVYPNPAQDNVFVSLPDNSKDAVVMLMDAAGRILYTQHIAAGQSGNINVAIPVTNYAVGLYQIVVKMESASVVRPVSIVR